MADTKITALTAISTVDPAVDVFPIVDVSDTTMAASGTTKKITSNQLLGAGGTATLASATISGDLTVDTNTLKVDSANNRVGIGVAVTGFGSTLTVSGDIEIVGGNKTLFNSAGFLQIGTSTANYLALQTNSTERYRIASDGVATWSNVGGVAGTAMTLNSTGLGIGVSPSNNLHVQGASGATAIRISAVTDGTLGFIGSASGLISGSPANNLAVRAENGLYLSGGGNATQFILNSSGNVGIGVTPSALLHVQKSQNSETTAIINNTNTGTSAGVRLDLQSNSSNYLTLQSFGQNYSGNAFGIAAAKLNVVSENSATAFSSGLAIGTTSSNPLYFATSNAVKMTLDASGNLLVGVTSANASGGVLQLKSGITFPATQVASSDANTLDDYEEGTFTATLKGTVSDPTTPVTTTARYTKIGRVVTVTIQFSSVTTTGASGRIQIDGLPFTNNSSLAGTGSVGFNGMATFTGSPFASLSASSSTIAMFASNSAGAYTAVTFNAGTTQDLWTSLTYTV